MSRELSEAFFCKHGTFRSGCPRCLPLDHPDVKQATYAHCHREDRQRFTVTRYRAPDETLEGIEHITFAQILRAIYGTSPLGGRHLVAHEMLGRTIAFLPSKGPAWLYLFPPGDSEIIGPPGFWAKHEPR